MLVRQRGPKPAEGHGPGNKQIVPQGETEVGTNVGPVLLVGIRVSAFHGIVVQSQQYGRPVSVGLCLAEAEYPLVLHVQAPGHRDLVLINGHREVLVAYAGRDVHQGAAGVRSIGDLYGVDGGIGHVLFLHLIVDVGERSCRAVECGIGDALVAVVQILTSRSGRAVLQLTELHFLAGLAGVSPRALAPEVVPRDVAGAVVIARITHAHVIRYHALQDFVVIECHVAELHRRWDIVRL